jgi:ABC-type branched-subunit amino acid transport system substrate-binding protein
MAVIRKSALALSMSAALVACAGVPTATAPSGEPTVVASEAPASTPQPAAPLIPERPAPIKVGIVEPLSGPLAPQGVDNVDGFNRYLASVNKTIADRKIDVLTADS